MKFITIILSVYFLALNVLPCNDANVPDNDPQTQLVNGTNDDYPHGSGDLCSPFCQCHCCHVHSIDFGVTAFEPVQPLLSQEKSVHFDSLGKDVPLSLLQPPRV